MGLQKIQGDQLFTGTTLLNNKEVLLIDNAGLVHEIVPEEIAGSDIQKVKGIVSPGFINCHCHLELSHMKGLIPEGTGLVDFVFKVVTQRHFPEEEIAEAIEQAEHEMIANGIVAVGDICNNTDTLTLKNRKNLAYYNFIEASGWLPTIAETRFSRSKNHYDEYFASNITTSIVPHAPYSVSEKLWSFIIPYFSNKVVSIHNQETVFEDELFLQGTGDFVRMYEMMSIDNNFHIPSKKSSLQTYFSKLKPAVSIILVHNTFTSKADIDFAIETAKAQEQILSFCLCANANLYIEEKLPPVDLLRKTNCEIVIGTDSLASNHSLSILDELKTIHSHFPSASLRELLQWGTSNGAKALQMDDRLGSFEKGKQPGVIVIDGIENSNLTDQSTIRKLV